jgi:uncharacterized protein (DUF1330 family)
MATYVIGTAEIIDSAGMEEYRNRVVPVIEDFGGRFVAAGVPEVREGEIQPHVAVIIEFPNAEQARLWYDSDSYRELKAMRQRSTRGTTLILDGLPIG